MKGFVRLEKLGKRYLKGRSQGSSNIELPGIIFLFLPDLNQIESGQIRMDRLLIRSAALTG